MTALTFTAISKDYGKVHALTDVSFDVAQGELVALLGPNGAGKTTSFEMILGLTSPSSGDVRVHGRMPGSRAITTRVGAMLQNAGLQESITVREVVRLIGRSYPRAFPVDDVLKRVGLADRHDRMLNDLSGGERQRLLLATAIIGGPDLLVLDEPTAAMDIAGRRTFWDEARASVADGTTILFATHDLAEADEVSDRVIILREGHVVADATPAELKRRVHTKVAEFVSDVPESVVKPLVADGTIASVRPQGSDHWRYEIHADRPAHVIAMLVGRGDSVDDLAVRDAALEDAFVELTTGPTQTGALS